MSLLVEAELEWDTWEQGYEDPQTEGLEHIEGFQFVNTPQYLTRVNICRAKMYKDEMHI